ncbi:MAG: hypothetical protein Q9218_004297 [Villophora microphyllina]
MFAVPGWSVSAKKLTTQVGPLSKSTGHASEKNGQAAPSEKKAKKRKRDHSRINGTNVTEDNVNDLWQKHIEGRAAPRKLQDNANTKPREKKRRRKDKGNDAHDQANEKNAQEITDKESDSKAPLENHGSSNVHTKDVAIPPPPHDGKTKYEQRKAKALEKAKRRESQPQLSLNSTSTPNVPPSPLNNALAAAATTTATTLKPPPAPSPQPAKLTPLQTAMRSKLISARFRHLNQTLYTTPSTHALSLFSSDPEAYNSYHLGFRSQVASWPQNPVEGFIQDIRIRGAMGVAKGKRAKGKAGKDERKEGSSNEMDLSNGYHSGTLDPLPRFGKCTIIDLGCGDAHLHASLRPYTSSLDLAIQSFDLSSGSGPNANLITVADIAHLPLADGSADVAIFCLALMGTNWVDFVAEAARVVRVGGECWIGEVKSRFVGAKEVSRAAGGAHRKSAKTKKRKNGDDDDEEVDNQGPLQVEEEADVVGGKRATTKDKDLDVGPFLKVFERRGFTLKGEVDLGNKMFVRMRFVRVRDAIKSAQARGRPRDGNQKFIDGDDGVGMDKEAEARILKPCVYKTR